MELRERKKLASQAFYQHLQNLNFGKGVLSYAKDIATIVYPDQTQVRLFFSEVSTGMAKSEFTAVLNLIIAEGPIYNALNGAGVDAVPNSHKRFFFGRSESLIPKRLAGYKFKTQTKIEPLAKKMVNDIDKYLLPIVKIFTVKYPKALDFVLANPRFFEKPFCTTIVLLGLTGSFGRLEEITGKVKKNQFFADYHRNPKPDALVGRIRKWFRKEGK